MKKVTLNDELVNRWLGIIGAVLIVLEPLFMRINVEVGLALAGSGLIAVGSYIFSRPRFKRNFGYRLLGLVAYLGIFLVTVIYAFAMFALLKL